jgi:hypothetical protein
LTATLQFQFAAALAVAILVNGCGTPGAPQAPSLNLPEPVNDLAAVRTGNQVALTWKIPRKNTDKLLLKGEIPVQICRKDGNGVCIGVLGNPLLAPGALGSFTDTLPLSVATGSPRSLTYFVELVNRNGRSAGPSNPAVVLAGQAPPPIEGLSAKTVKAGVVLRWASTNSTESVRLHRKLLTPPASKLKTPQGPGASGPSHLGTGDVNASMQGPMAPAPEPVEQNLLVEPTAEPGHPGRALDKDIRFGETYEYRAQRVARVTIDGNMLELAGPLSDPIRVAVIDVFPPAVPTGLAAVATLGHAGTETAIDLSWQPVTDTDIAGYIVYRREGDAAWQRISPAQPIVPPGFHDPHVASGHTYHYAVSAIDQSGHESAHSTETEETVPNP